MSTKQRWTHAALPFLAALSITAGASAISSMQAVSAGRAELLTGGVGEQERRELLERAPEYDLFVSFASRSSGAYLSDVSVTLTGRALDRPIELTTNGPLLLANLPAGRYALSAEVPGWKPRQRALDIERAAHQSVWITFVPESEDP